MKNRSQHSSYVQKKIQNKHLIIWLLGLLFWIFGTAAHAQTCGVNMPSPVSVCVQDTFQLSIEKETTQRFFWQQIEGTSQAYIKNPYQLSTGVVVFKTGIYRFELLLTCQDGTQTRHEVVVDARALPTVFGGYDQFVCNVPRIFLDATATTGFWRMISGPNNPIIESSTNKQTYVSNTKTGTYLFEFATKIIGCTARDTVQINNETPSSVAVAGNDLVLCAGPTTAQLNAQLPAVGTGFWEQIAGNSMVFTDKNAPNTRILDLQKGDYNFKWTVTNKNSCPNTSDEVLVIVTDTQATITAGLDQKICASSILQLKAAKQVNGIGTWQVVAVPANAVPVFDDIHNPEATVNGLITGIYLFRWSNGTGSCASSDDVMISVVESPKVSATLSCSGGEGSGRVIVNSSTNQSLTYSLDSGSKQIFPFFNNVANGTHNIQVTNVLTGCSVSHDVQVSCQNIPIIGVVQSAGVAVKKSVGIYDIPYTILVKNMGNTPLKNVQVASYLANVFPKPVSFSVQKLTVNNSILAVNTAFNGANDINLLLPNSTLAVGAVHTIQATVRVYLNGSTLSQFSSIVKATATDGAMTTIDESNAGGISAIDPNRNNNPNENGENEPTIVTINSEIIGLSNKVEAIRKTTVSDVYEVDLLYFLKNLGNTSLQKVQLKNYLKYTFPLPATYQIVGIELDNGLTLNRAFDGNINPYIFDATQSILNAGETKQVRLKLKVTLNGSTKTTFFNASAAMAYTPSGIATAEDASNEGGILAIDPNNNGNPADYYEDIVTRIELGEGKLQFGKKVLGSPVRNADGSYDISYIFTLKNISNTVLEKVQIKDNLSYAFVLPAQYNVIGNGVTGATDAAGKVFLGVTDANSQLLTGTGSLQPNESKELYFTVRVLPNGSSQTFYNLALASAVPVGKNETILLYSSSTDNFTEAKPATVFLDTYTNLKISQRVSNGTPNVGENIAFAITIENKGPNIATNISIQDNLPDGILFTGSRQLSNYSGVLRTKIASLPVGESTEIELLAKVIKGGKYENIAQILGADQSSLSITTSGGRVATSLTTPPDVLSVLPILVQEADLSISLAVNNTKPLKDEIVNFTLHITNAGPDAATNVQARVNLPLNFYVTANTDFALNANTLLSKLIASIPANSSIDLVFSARFGGNGNVVVQAEVTKSDQFDPDSQPNNGTVNGEDDATGLAMGSPQADISLNVAISDNNPNVGSIITGTFTVSNAGPDIATGISIKSIFPNELQLLPDLAVSNNTLTNTWATVLSGESQSIIFQAKVLANGSFKIAGEVVASNEFDPDSQPNTGVTNRQDDVAIADLTTQYADLAIMLDANNRKPLVGQDILFTITVTNTGKNMATNIVIADSLNNNHLAFVSSPDFIQSGTRLLANIALLAVGATKTIVFVAKALTIEPNKNYVAIIASDQFDPDSRPNNNFSLNEDDASAVFINGQQADLQLQLLANSTESVINQDLVYTVTVKNTGSDRATNVEVKDILPTNLLLINAQDFVALGNVLTATITAIEPNTTVQLNFVARAIGKTNILNKAEISKADQFDPDSQPNTGTEDGQDDTDLAFVRMQQADLALTKTASNAKPNLGDIIVFTLTVQNEGGDDATNVRVRDVLPAGLEFVASDDFMDSGVLLSRNIPKIAFAEQVALTFQAKVKTTGTIINQAEIWESDQNDPDSTPANGTNNNEDDIGVFMLGEQQADLSLTKITNRTIANVGETITFSLTVSNAGPSTATNIEVRDVLPIGLSFLASNVFVNNGGILLANIPSLKAGTAITLTFDAQLNTIKKVTNQAEISKSDQNDPDSTPNNGTTNGEDDTAEASISSFTADLSLLKDVSNKVPNVGETVTFSLTVSNAGPDVATNVKVQDILPLGLTTSSVGDFIAKHDTLSAIVPMLAVGATKVLTFIANVVQGGNIINRAEITQSDQFDPDSTPDNGIANGEDDAAQIGLNGQQADISITKDVDKLAVNIGDTLTFTIRMRNSGTSTATNVRVRDILPTGLVFISGSSNVTFANGVATGFIASLPNRASTLFTIRAKAIKGGGFINKAEVATSDQFDPDSTPNNGTENAEDDRAAVNFKVYSADLSLEKMVDNPTFNYGDTLTYILVIRNSGPDTARTVQVRDFLPNDLVLISSSDFTVNTNGLLSFIIPEIFPNKNVSLSFKAKVLPSAVATILNRAEIIKSATYDPDSQPNTGTNDAQDDAASVNSVLQQADLSLNKTVDLVTATLGDRLTYTITVSNAGPDAATNIEIKDLLPKSLHYETGSFAKGLGDTLIANIRHLASGASYQMMVSAKIIATGTIVNQAEITKSDQKDADSKPNSGFADGQDDTASATTTASIADLSLKKRVDNVTPNFGSIVTYVIDINNQGPDPATDIEITDALPAGLIFDSSNDFVQNANVLKATIASLPKGVQKSVSFKAKVTGVGKIINHAQISKVNEFDSDSKPNSGYFDGEDDTDSVAIAVQLVNVSIKKTGSKSVVEVGEEFTYSIVVNNLPIPNQTTQATNVVVQDILPQGIVFVSSSDLQLSNNILSATIPILASGANKTLTFRAKALNTAAGNSLWNRASIIQADQSTTQKIIADSVQVRIRKTDISLTKLVNKILCNVNDELTFELVLKNIGSDSAFAIRVQDILPQGLTYVSGADFTASANVLSSKLLPFLAPNKTDTLRFVAKVVQAGSITNKAEITANNTFDANIQNNASFVTIVAEQNSTTLSIEKRVNKPSASPSDTLTYSIILKNNGLIKATNVVVTDFLPALLGFVSSNDFVLQGGNLVSRNISEILVNQQVELQLKAKVNALTGEVINKAEITKFDQKDSTQPTPTALASIQVVSVDLSLKKDVSKRNPSVGEVLIYTLTVNNTGKSAATGIEIIDYLPAGLSLVASADFVLSGTNLKATIANLGAGENRILAFSARVNTAGNVLNKAEITKIDQYDIDSKPNNGTENNEDDTDRVAINGEQADLSLLKTVSNPKPNVGETITFSLTVNNAGPSRATAIEIKDILSAGLQFVSGDVGIVLQNNNTVLANIAGLDANASVTLTFQAKITASETIVNHAEISKADQQDPDSKPNSGTNDNQDDQAEATVVPRLANLSLSKWVSKSNVNVGDEVTFYLIVKNAGPATATNVSVRDPLSENLQFVSGTNFINEKGVLQSLPRIILAGKTDSLLFKARILKEGQITNRAEIATSDVFDPNSQPSSGFDDGQDDVGAVQLNAQAADLSLSKTVLGYSTNHLVGDTLVYVLEVRNAGPSIATNIQLRDELPFGLNFSSSTDFTSIDNVLFSKNIASIPVGNSVKLYFKAKIVNTGGTEVPNTIINRAEISKADQFDPDSKPATGTNDGQDDIGAVSVMIQESDISLRKTVSNVQPNIGEIITYTIAVHNAGPDLATNIEVTDYLPSGLKIQNPQDFSLVANTLVGTIRSIAVGTTAELKFTAKVALSGAVLNKAEITKADQYDPDSKPNNGTENREDDTGGVIINGLQADLSLKKYADRSVANIGDIINYRLVVKNVGPDPATGVQVQDNLPAGLQFVESLDLDHANNVLRNIFLETIAPNDSIEFLYRAKVVAYKPLLTNKAEIHRANEYDPDSKPNTGYTDHQDDTDSLSVTVEMADLSLTKTVNTPNARAGEIVTFTFTVANAGPNMARNVSVKDILPPGLLYMGGNDITNNAGTLITNTKNVAANTTTTWQFSAKVTRNEIIINRAEIVTSDQFDPDSQPNSGTNDNQDDIGQVAINGGVANLSLRKKTDNYVPVAGQTIQFSLIVSNVGPAVAQNVLVKDYLPTGLKFVSSNDMQLQADGSVLGKISQIGVGESIALLLKTKVESIKPITNKAEIIFAEQFDPNSTPNNGTGNSEDDTDSLTINGNRADLSLLKRVSYTLPMLGDTIEYDLMVINAGPHEAHNIQVKDVLPNGLAFVSTSNTSHNGNEITGTLAKLPANQSYSFKFKAKATQKGIFTNNAQITESSEYDPDSTPNNGTKNGEDDASESTISTRYADLALFKTVNKIQAFVADTLTYTLRVRNNGNAETYNVALIDQLPKSLTFLSGDAGISHQNGLVKVTLNRLDNNQEKAFTFRVIASGNGLAENNTWNKASIFHSDLPDTTPADNSDSVQVYIIDAKPAIRVQKKIIENPVLKNDLTYDLTYQISYQNTGNVPLELATIIDNLSQTFKDAHFRVNYTGAVGDNASGSDFNGTSTGSNLLKSSKITLPVGFSGVVTFTVNVKPNQLFSFENKVIAQAFFRNKAVVDSSVYTVSLQNVAQWAVEKRLSGSPIQYQDGSYDIPYQIILTNTGNTLLENIQVKDTLSRIFGTPIAFNVTSDGVRGSSDAVGSLYTGIVPYIDLLSGTGNLPVADRKILNYTVHLKPKGMLQSIFINLAVASATYLGGGKLTQSDTTLVQLDTNADVCIAKTASRDTVQIGDRVTFTFRIKNGGSNDATNVIIQDILPDGLSYVSASKGIQQLGNAYQFLIPYLPVGEQRLYAITAQTTKLGKIRNVATIQADQPDYVPSNNSDDASILVVNCNAPRITASKTGVCSGDSLTLTASGCLGVAIWSNGKVGNSIVERPTKLAEYSAYCDTDYCKSSSSSPISVVVFSPPKVSITPSKTSVCPGESISLSATGCSGMVLWQDGRAGNVYTTAPTVSTMYSYLCIMGECRARPESFSITPTLPAAPVIVAEKTAICSGDSAPLTATGCDGVVQWSDNQKGNNITVKPVVTTTYSAVCNKATTCSSNISNVITIEVTKPNEPTIQVSSKTTCAGGGITVSATGCNGSVAWSNGMAGESITISVQVTTYLSAACQIGLCRSAYSDVIELTVAKPSPPVVTCSKKKLCIGDSTKLYSNGCNGQSIWSNGAIGETIMVSPDSTTIYTAICKIGTCESGVSNQEYISVSVPQTPQILANKTMLCAGESSVLTANSCSGILTWSNGKTGLSITVKPTVTTTYSATCVVGECSRISKNLLIEVHEPMQIPSIKATTLKNSCPITFVNLNDALISTSSDSSKVFIFTNSAGEVINPDSVTLNGHYFVTEVSTMGCQSKASEIIVVVDKCSTTDKNADIAITLTANPLQIDSLGVVTFTVTIKNNGPAMARNIMLSDTLSGFQFVSGKDFTNTSGILTAKIDSLPNGKSIVLTFTAKAIVNNKQVKNTVSVTKTDTPDPISTNNKASIMVLVGKDPTTDKNADIAITLAANPLQIDSLGVVTFTVTIKNNGPAMARNIMLSDTLLGFQFVSGKDFTNTSGILMAKIDSLPNGKSIVLTFVAKAIVNNKQVKNTVSVTKTDTPDPISTNNKAAISITVGKISNTKKSLIGLAKESSLPVKIAGEKELYEVSYLIYLKNMGTDDLKRVQVEDDLMKVFENTGIIVPAQKLSIKADTGLVVNPNYLGAAPNAKLLNDTLSILPKGKTRTIRLTFTIDMTNASKRSFSNIANGTAQTADGTLTSDFSTAGKNPDPDNDGDPTNNKETTTITIEKLDLSKLGIGLANAVADTTRKADGSYDVTYKYILKNYASMAVQKVALIDSLTNTFPISTIFTILDVRASKTGSLQINKAYNGITDHNLLTDQSSLAASASDTLWLKLNVEANTSMRTFYNSAWLQGYNTSDLTKKLIDQSTEGLIPDLNNNQNASDIGENKATALILPPLNNDNGELFIPEGFSPNGDGINDYFVIRNIPVGVTVNLEIFNQLGHIVYASENYQNNWNGTSNQGLQFQLGNKDSLPDATYYYVAQFSNGLHYVRFLTLMR